MFTTNTNCLSQPELSCFSNLSQHHIYDTSSHLEQTLSWAWYQDQNKQTCQME